MTDWELTIFFTLLGFAIYILWAIEESVATIRKEISYELREKHKNDYED